MDQKKQRLYLDNPVTRKFPWLSLEKYRPRWLAKVLYGDESRYAQEKVKKKLRGQWPITPEEEQKLHQLQNDLLQDLNGLPIDAVPSASRSAKKNGAPRTLAPQLF